MKGMDLVAFLRYAVDQQESYGVRGISLAFMDGLTGVDFETVCAYILLHNGFTDVMQTKATGDFGADIVARYEGNDYAIQCKRYNAPIGNKAVQEVYAGAVHYGCSCAAVITNSTFTEQAQQTAEELGVMLVDRAGLEQLLH